MQKIRLRPEFRSEPSWRLHIGYLSGRVADLPKTSFHAGWCRLAFMHRLCYASDSKNFFGVLTDRKKFYLTYLFNVYEVWSRPEISCWDYWRGGNALCRINEVTLRRARLVPGWVTVCAVRTGKPSRQVTSLTVTKFGSAFYPPWDGKLNIKLRDRECSHYSCLPADLLAQADRLGPKVGGHLALRATFIQWTGWTLAVAVAVQRWLHHKHCLSTITITMY